MTANRRWHNAACGPNQIPVSSGPRKAMVAVMADTVAHSLVRSRSKSTQPAMPHIQFSIRQFVRTVPIRSRMPGPDGTTWGAGARWPATARVCSRRRKLPGTGIEAAMSGSEPSVTSRISMLVRHRPPAHPGTMGSALAPGEDAPPLPTPHLPPRALPVATPRGFLIARGSERRI